MKINNFKSILKIIILFTIMSAGFGEILHYNGMGWKSYKDITKINDGAYYSVEIKKNLVVAVDQDNPAAVLIIGRLQLFLVDKYSDGENSIKKEAVKQISYEGSLAVKDYALVQNYPNLRLRIF